MIKVRMKRNVLHDKERHTREEIENFKPSFAGHMVTLLLVYPHLECL